MRRADFALAALQFERSGYAHEQFAVSRSNGFRPILHARGRRGMPCIALEGGCDSDENDRDSSSRHRDGCRTAVSSVTAADEDEEEDGEEEEKEKRRG